MEHKRKIIATVINDVVFDQRMIRICNTLSEFYSVELWGRVKSSDSPIEHSFIQRRYRFFINRGVLFYISYNIRLFFILLFTKFDVIHSVDLDTLPAGFLACKIKRKQIVYDSHEYFTEVPELENRYFVKKIWLIIEKIFVPRVDVAITVGTNIAKIYFENYKKQFHVVRNCPEIHSSTSNHSEDRYIIYQGALNKGRGLESLIKAMKTIPLRLLIAGDGDIRDKLENMVIKEQLSDKVEFLGQIKPNELINYTSQAFLGYNVMENIGLSYYYSLSNKFFDYIHSDVPVITNPFPEYYDLNKTYNCCVFAEAISNNISEVILSLLNDTKEYNRLKSNCNKASKDLNWNTEKNKLIRAYDDLIQ